jgi:FtsH-binding integral membrane protein
VHPGAVLLFNGAVAAILLAAAAFARRASRAYLALAAVPLSGVLVLSLYVFGEDTYRRGGISRWDAYRSPGGALGSMYVASVAAMALCAAALAYAAATARPRAFRIAAATGGLASLGLLTPTIIGFGTN